MLLQFQNKTNIENIGFWLVHFGFALHFSYTDLWNIDLLDTDIPSKYFVCLRNVFKTSSSHVLKTSSRHLFKTSLSHVFMTSSRHVFKTSWRRLQRKTSWRPLQMFWSPLEWSLEDLYSFVTKYNQSMHHIFAQVHFTVSIGDRHAWKVPWNLHNLPHFHPDPP